MGLDRKVSQLTNRKKKKKHSLRVCDKEGNVLTDSDKVQERWNEYTEELYKNNKAQEEVMHLETDMEEDVKRSPILFSEFEASLSELIYGKQKERMGYWQKDVQ